MPDKQHISKAQPTVYVYVPSSHVGIRVGVHMVGDIPSRLISVGVTRDTGRRRSILVDADVVEAHGCW